ncbi:MAG: chalcone isomerase family protein [Thermodesulfobacteriota bacterium]
MRALTVFFLAMFLVLPAAQAKDVSGVNVPDTINAEGQTLHLNGAAARKKFGFVKVYVGALYLQARGTDANAIINADEPMAITMSWIYDNTARERVSESWREGFERAVGAKETAALKPQIDQFCAAFPDPYKKNDVYTLVYIPGKGVVIEVNGKETAVIPGMEFKKAMFGNWLGPNPGDSSLKNLKAEMLKGK